MRELVENAESKASRLEEGIGQANILSCHLRQKLEHAQDVIREVAYVLGDTFIALPVKTNSVQMLMDLYRVSAVRDMPSFREAMYSMEAAEQCVSMMVHELQGNQLKTARDHLRGMIHVAYLTPKGDRHYAISESAWYGIPPDSLEKIIYRDIAENLAKSLVQEVRK
jgi:hypothetical protein